MAIKSTFTKAKSKIKFPKLMVNQKTKKVVLFEEPGYGVVVSNNYNETDLYTSLIAPDGDMREFSDYNGILNIESTGDHEFPKFMKSNYSGLIILFLKYQSGFVIDTGSSNWESGHFANNWGMGNFETIFGSVILSNQKIDK